MNFSLTSRAFAAGQELPTRFTREGDNVSPALEWSMPPPGTRSLVVICDEPNSPAGNVVHWLLYNLPATTLSLPEHLPAIDPLANGARQGVNDFSRTGYSGPVRPTAGSRRMLFQVFALNTVLTTRTGVTKSELIRAMESRVIARARLTATVKAATVAPAPASSVDIARAS